MKKISQLRKLFKNWYLRIFERLGFVNGDITYTLRDLPLEFTFPAKKRGTALWIIEDMLLHDPYNDVRVLAVEEPVVVDLGGNIGSFSVLQAHRWSSASVYAYEAHPVTFSYLRKNIEQNALSKRVHAHNRAVFGEKISEKVKLYEDLRDAGSNSLFVDKKGIQANKYIEVEAISLKEIFEHHKLNYIDLLKLDVEGAEYEILENSQELLKKIKYIALEYHDVQNKTVDDLKKLLQKNNFFTEQTSSKILHCFNKSFYRL